MAIKPLNIEKIESLFDEFRALRAVKRQQQLLAMTRLFSTFNPEILQSRTDRFNLFSLFDIKTDQVRHNRFLAWLLDAKADHGQGNIFLMSLAEICRLNVPPASLAGYTVRSEFSGNESVIDIMICRQGEFLIYLENKVLGQEGSGQIDRAYRDMHRLGKMLDVPKERGFAIFLTPDGRQPVSGDATRWYTLSYGKLAESFELLAPEITSAKVKFVLQDWFRTILTGESPY